MKPSTLVEVNTMSKMLTVVKLPAKERKYQGATKDQVIAGAQYFLNREWNHLDLLEKPFIPLHRLSLNCWKGLADVGVKIDGFQKEVSYSCPFHPPNVYFMSYPAMLVMKDQDHFDEWMERLKETGVREWKIDMIRDYHFFRMIYWGVRRDEPCDLTPEELKRRMGLWDSSILLASIGHGYTDSTYPNDGSTGKTTNIVMLSDGTEMACPTWEWFNK